MVCIYCGNSTRVVNSRHQKKANQVWRRRQCASCEAVFTSLERVDMHQALQVEKHGHFEPFSRDKLLLTIYDSLRHRKTAVEDAEALTETVLSQLYPAIRDASVERDAIVTIADQVLSRFDKAAATHYRAFHP